MLSDQIRAAGIIAENVVSALERLDGDSLAKLPREAAIAGLMRELMAVMPTRFDGVLAAACKRYLATLQDQGWAGPRVETVSMVDGSVTMRSG
ncbi:hypothetical protein [Methylobacterium sp. J-077]|uniref:hypothetical protein n=1 Tax=Methylobacterium sp. J-077 TaxID=2836656 RepID=UPI001FBA1EEF|nr:hypothetical protein [Methylobacterium sp. J-077]MCJ2126435.1 hypothetical protein [Methylobacterium sp. J-077]